MLSIAIVGLGPWGVCALERIVTSCREGLASGAEVKVHVVEPGIPGPGVYDISQPDYLLLNNPCGQLSLYPFATGGDTPSYGLGLYEWAVRRGYRWLDDRCVVGQGGEQIERHHFLPRRLMGEYLHWFYRELAASAPSTLTVVHHRTSAVDVVRRRAHKEEVRLASGLAVIVDHVIVTSGHTANRERASTRFPAHLKPYPVTSYVEGLPEKSSVAVSGLGLVAIDVVTALTVGRGGRFTENGGGLRYRPSGREPTIQMFSRSGLPFTAKSVTGIDRASVYRPIICTPEAFDDLSGRCTGQRRLVDVRAELLPMLFGEMTARYYAQLAFQASSIDEAARVRRRLREAWHQGRFQAEADALAARFGRFDPEALFFGHQPCYSSSEDYERFVYSTLADDLREADVPDGASPVKSATEVLRIFRDPMRSVVEQGGMSLDSYVDFNVDIRSRIHRLVAGPPALRFRQMLALIDAGVLRTPYGPAPALGASGSGTRRTRLSSTAFECPHVGEADVLIRGHLDEPRLDGSASELLNRLYNRGRLSQFRYGVVNVGSIHLTPDSHPVDLEGRTQQRVWVFGVLTEGIRHFTHYLPSPRSRIRAFEEIGSCVAEILGAAAARGSGEAAAAALLDEPVAI